MGVGNINKLIKRHASDAFFSLPIERLSGKRIAIDGTGWIYSSMMNARKKVVNRTDIAIQEPNINEIRREWFLLVINFIIGWLAYNITPVFIFDGEHPPEKDDTKNDRREKRISARAKIDALYLQLKNDSIEYKGAILDDLRDELRNYSYISPEDHDLFKMIVKGIGIPCLQARGEGEQLCSMLCIEKKVAAVFSKDTDNFAYGCPLLITGFSKQYGYDSHGNRVAMIDCVRHDKILSGLNFPHNMFVDLCIMSGCDYNTNMPGYATIKSYDLLKKYGSIDDLPRNFNIECLKHNNCRELFKYVNSDTVIVREDSVGDEPVNLFDINKHALTTARDYLEMVGVSGQIERLLTAYQRMNPSSDGFVDELMLPDAPRYVPPQKRIYLNIQQPYQSPKILHLNIIQN